MITLCELVLFVGVWAYVFVPYFFDGSAPAPPEAVPSAGKRARRRKS